MTNHGIFLTKFFARLTAALLATLLVSVPLHAQVKFKYGLVQSKADAGFFWMAQEKGFFKKHGVEVEYLQFRGDKDVARALLAGEVDAAEISPAAELNAIDRGADLRFIGSSMPGFPYALYVKKDITSWEQLKGKTFGVSSPGSVPEIIAREMLIRKGVDDSTIQIVNAGGSGLRIKALVGGKIDAAASSSEYIPEADKLGIKVMALAADLVPEYPRFVIVAFDETLKAKRETVINFLAAYMEGMDYALKHRDETLKLSAKINDKPVNDPTLAHMFDEVFAKGYLSVKSEVPRAKIDWLQNVLLKHGTIRKKVDLDKYIDESYRKEALKRADLR